MTVFTKLLLIQGARNGFLPRKNSHMVIHKTFFKQLLTLETTKGLFSCLISHMLSRSSTYSFTSVCNFKCLFKQFFSGTDLKISELEQHLSSVIFFKCCVEDLPIHLKENIFSQQEHLKGSPQSELQNVLPKSFLQQNNKMVSPKCVNSHMVNQMTAMKK